MRTHAGFRAILLALVTVAGLGPAGAQDRQTIEVPPEGRELVLAEMRTMLSSVAGIVGGLAENDMASVAAAARASGAAAAVDMAPELSRRLPVEFKQLGMSVHNGFDDLAAAAKSGATRAEVLEQLRTQLGACVACHETYRLAVP